MSRAAEHFRDVINLVGQAEVYRSQMDNEDDIAQRDLAVIAYSRTLDELFAQLRLLRRDGTLTLAETYLRSHTSPD